MTQVPCPECGADVMGGEDTTALMEEDFEFGGENAETEVPGKICPECGGVVAL